MDNATNALGPFGPIANLTAVIALIGFTYLLIREQISARKEDRRLSITFIKGLFRVKKSLDTVASELRENTGEWRKIRSDFVNGRVRHSEDKKNHDPV